MSFRSSLRLADRPDEDIPHSPPPVTAPPVRQPYVSFALIVTNTLVAFLALNIVLAGIFLIKDGVQAGLDRRSAPDVAGSDRLFNSDGSPIDNGKRNMYQLAWIDYQAYGQAEPKYVGEVLDDFYELNKRGMAYQPWVEFAEPEFQGKRVVVGRDPKGFLSRRTVNPPNQEGLPVVKVFAFGGSTTFGYNVADEQTWPSYLSQVLNARARARSLGLHIEVTNYGRGYYYPTQETALLIDLLKSGHRPQAVIFMDGVNSGGEDDTPEFFDQVRKQFHNLQFAEPTTERKPFLDTWKWIPVVRLAASMNARLGWKQGPTVAQRESTKDAPDIQRRVNVFRHNREIAEAICRLYSITPLFIIQPSAVYNYPVSLYRRPMPDEFYAWRVGAKLFYERMRVEPGVIYFGDLFAVYGSERKAIIDELHYSPSFHSFLAEQIAVKIPLQAFDPRRPALDPAAATVDRRT